MIICDSQFIKIFTFDLIRKFNRDQNQNIDLENTIMLRDQEEKIADQSEIFHHVGNFSEELKIIQSEA